MEMWSLMEMEQIMASNNVFTIVTSEAVVIKDITFANHVASDGGAIFIKGTSQSNLLDCNVLHIRR